VPNPSRHRRQTGAKQEHAWTPGDHNTLSTTRDAALFGIAALPVTFRLLAVEAGWAARAYAWTDWRFTQLRD